MAVIHHERTRHSALAPVLAASILAGCFEARDVCQANSTRCGTPGDFVERCNGEASGWLRERSCSEGERCVAGSCVGGGGDGGLDHGLDRGIIGPDGSEDATPPSCEPVLVEPFDDPALPGWEPGSLVLSHAEPAARLLPMVEQGWYVQGEASPSLNVAGGGHHRPLPRPLDAPVQLVARVSANHEAPGSQVAVGLFEDVGKLPCCDEGDASGRGWVCAWFPNARRVEIRLMPEAAIVAAAAVPDERVDSGWHELSCVHDEDGRWAFAIDGEGLVTTVNIAAPTTSPLEVLSTYLSARSPGQRLDHIDVLPCP